MSKSSLNAQQIDPSDKFNLEGSSINNSKSNLQNNQNKNVNFNLNPNENDYEEEYDLIEKNQFPNSTLNQETRNNHSDKTKHLPSKQQIMPHDKNAINFLINEYLLENNYKMTSVTFSEENESLDLEDWDVVGLNRSKPPNLFQLYKLYLNKSKLLENTKKEFESNKKEAEVKVDAEVQVEIETKTSETNTECLQTKNFESLVNFDRDTFENQRMQINKLLEKQEILLKSLTKLESEISTLNSERETNLKKIDLLTVSLEKSNSTVKYLTENLNKQENENSEQKEVEMKTVEVSLESNERKIPVVFKEMLTKYSEFEFSAENRAILSEMSNLRIENEFFISSLFKYLPILTPNVNLEKRLEMLPIILLAAILEQEDIAKNNSKKESNLIKLLFNLIDKPNEEQRAMILAGCIQYTKYVGPIYVNNYLLSQCWEQLNDKLDERRILVAEACASLAPHIYNDMRSSLMFSILKHLIEQETSEQVRICSVKSLAILVNYIKDEQKFFQCVELLDLCATDSSVQVIKHVEELLMPSLSLWALSINKLADALIMHLLNKAEFHLLHANRQKIKKNENDVDHERHALTYMNLLNLNVQYIFGFVLIHFREAKNGDEVECAKKLSKLNSYFHALQEKVDIKLDLYKIDSILEDYLCLTLKYLNLIESDLWSSIELSNAFTWLSDTFIRKLIQMSAQVDAKDPLCFYFVQLFRNFTLLFAIDYELIKSKVFIKVWNFFLENYC